MNKIKCFYKHVTKKGNVRLIELPIKRIEIKKGIMGFTYRLTGRPIAALRRVVEYYHDGNNSLNPEALVFVKKLASGNWYNITNNEFDICD